MEDRQEYTWERSFTESLRDPKVPWKTCLEHIEKEEKIML